MAQPITWQQVSGPNFSGVNDSQRLAGTALNNAFSGLSEGLGKFDEYNKSANAATLLANAAKFANPNDLKAAIANGNVFAGVDPHYLTPAALEALDNHARMLMGRTLSQQEYDQNTVMNPLRAGELGANVQHQQLVNTFDKDTMPARVAGENINTGQRGFNLLKDQNTYGTDVNQNQDMQIGIAAAQRAAGQGNTPEQIDDALEATPGLTSRQREFAKDHLVKNNYKVGAGFSPVTNVLPANGVPGVTRPGDPLVTPPANPGAPGSYANPTGAATNPAAAALAAAAGDSTKPPSMFASSIPIGETRGYVQKVTSKLGDTTGMSRDQKLDLMFGRNPGDGGAIVGAESGNSQVDPKTGATLTSSAGAKGVAQVMPDTFAAMKDKYNIPGDINDKTANWKAGRAYMTELLDKYGGDVEKASAAYNAGPGRVDSWLANQPDTLRAHSIDLLNTANTTKADIDLRVGQNSATGLDDLAKTMRDSKTTPQQVFSMLKGGVPDPEAKPGSGAKLLGPYGDMSDNAIQNSIRDITDRAAAQGVAITPATAGALAQRFGRKGVRMVPLGEGWRTGNLHITEDNIALDPGIDDAIKNIGDSTGMQQNTASNLITKTLADNQQKALVDYQGKVDALQSLYLQAQRPGRGAAARALIPKAQDDLQRSEAILTGLTKTAQSADQYKPTFTDQNKAIAALRAATSIPTPLKFPVKPGATPPQPIVPTGPM